MIHKPIDFHLSSTCQRCKVSIGGGYFSSNPRVLMIDTSSTGLSKDSIDICSGSPII